MEWAVSWTGTSRATRGCDSGISGVIYNHRFLYPLPAWTHPLFPTRTESHPPSHPSSCDIDVFLQAKPEYPRWNTTVVVDILFVELAG